MLSAARRLGALVVALAIPLALALAGCGNPVVPVIPVIPVVPSVAPSPPSTPRDASRIVIGASFPVLDPFLASVADALTARAAALDVDLQVANAEGSADTQLQQLQAFVDQRVDAVIVVPMDTDATAPITGLVRGAGIALVYLNRRPADLPADGSIPYVGTDSLAGGTMQMESLVEQADGHGNVALLIGDPANEAAVLRTEGAKDVIVRHPDLRLLREAAAGWDRTQAHDAVQAWLTAGDTFDIVAANDDEMALGAIDALREADVGPGTLVGGIDGTADGLAAIRAGDVAVTVYEDATAQGTKAVDAAVDLARGRAVATEEGVIDVAQTLVTRDNVGQFLGQP